jgi:hypothetical protein
VKLPWPVGGVEASVDRSTYDFVSGAGNHRVSTLVGTSRSYLLNWKALHQINYDLINQFYLGHNGPGPFVILDPSRPNLLTANQSAATGQTFDTSGFIASSGTLSSQKAAAAIYRQFGRRGLQWTGTGTTVMSISMASTFTNWLGIPVLPLATYTFNYFMTASAGSMTGGPQLKWLTASGTTIRTDAPTQTTWTGWAQQVLTAVAPPNAAYVVPAMNVLMLVGGQTVYADALQLEDTQYLNEWAPGTGVLPVAIMDWNEDIPFDGMMRLGPTLALRELL